MKMFHATLATNLPSIIANGLKGAKSKGRLRVVWCCAKSKVSWAVLHTAFRHKRPIEQIVVCEINVQRRHLRRHGDGLWYSVEDVPARDVRNIKTFALVSR